MRSLSRTLCLLVATHAGVVLADEPQATVLLEPREKAPQITTLRSAHLRDLGRRDPREEVQEPNPTRERSFDRLQFAKGGLKYQERFELDGHRYRFSVRGPVQKGRQFGLTFELRF